MAFGSFALYRLLDIGDGALYWFDLEFRSRWPLAIIAFLRYSLTMGWRVEILDAAVAAELEALPVDLRAKFSRIAGLLEEFGPHMVREPYVKPLEGKLWEMRMKGRDGIARAIYLATHGQRLVVVHAFVKKTSKTPRGALELATRRAREGGLI